MPHVPIRIGVVGAGGICRSAHFPGFAKLDDCKLVAVANRTRESGERIAKEFSIPHVEDDWRKLVQRPDINVVLVGTWPYLHRDVTLAALAAGKHVLCESRMAWDAQHAHEMLAAAKAARRKGLVTMLAPPPTGFKGDYVMKELIAAGQIGTPYQLYARQMGAGYLDPAAPLHWRMTKKFQGLNAMTLGMVAEPVERWFGETTRVFASTRIFTKTRTDPATGKPGKVERPEVISILAEMKNGMQATYMFSQVALGAGHVCANGVEAYGSNGMIRYDMSTDRIFAASNGEKGLREVPIPPEKARTWQVEAEFAAAIRSGAPVSPSFEEGVKYMDFTEAVERSALSGEAVALPLRFESKPSRKAKKKAARKKPVMKMRR